MHPHRSSPVLAPLEIANRPAVRGVLNRIADRSGISITQLRGPDRSGEIAGVRACAAYLLHAEADLTWHETGLVLKRDRTACFQYARRVPRLLAGPWGRYFAPLFPAPDGPRRQSA